MQKYLITIAGYDNVRKKPLLFSMEHESISEYYFKNQELQDILSYFEFYGFEIYSVAYHNLSKFYGKICTSLSDSLSLKNFKNTKEKNNVHLQTNH